ACPRARPPLEDAIELYNPTQNDVAIGGWYLSDRRDDGASLRKFQIPAGSVIPAGGYAVFYAFQFNPSPGAFPSFELNGSGGGVYLSAAKNDVLTGYITRVQFDA